MWRKNAQRGFSLTEMMVVVAILIVLTAIAAPTLFRTVRRYEAESAARQVSNMVLRARYEAARRNQRVQVMAVWNSSSQSARVGLNFADASGDFNNTFDSGESFIQLPYLYSAWTPTDPWGPWTTGEFRDAPDYGAPHFSRITFTPRGTIQWYDSGTDTWQAAGNVTGVWISNFRGGGSSWLNWSHYFIVTVTPAGRIRVWRLAETDGTSWFYDPL